MSQSASDARLSALQARLSQVPDPEIPALTLADLGILRSVERDAQTGQIDVVITPTYSGCPATHWITEEVERVLQAEGFSQARVRLVYSPAWTTDWISEQGREKLLAYGIAPPSGSGHAANANISMREQPLHFLPRKPQAIACPLCNSTNTEQLNAFGSTPCKALYRCLSCREPFDYFKPF
jgi:ring-1,2-phenylacetyl-CoA epoxidase subunit PaaD